MTYLCYAACSFGLESVVAAELTKLGMQNVRARDARVYFDADERGVARANICMAIADRIYLVLDEFPAGTFDELFERVKAIPFGEYLPKNARFPVNADSVHSELKSVSDVQSISKKAVVESMRKKYGLGFYKEDGAAYELYVSILKNVASVCINTSGMGLNRRGYRVKNVTAPLRETLAAGLIGISGWFDRPFYDVMCGSGTIAIEAALKAKAQAPGLNRTFSAQFWPAFERAFIAEKAVGESRIIKPETAIFASDIDPQALEIAKFHAKRAGVSEMIRFSQCDVRDFAPEQRDGSIITNPPYAVRLGEKEETRKLYGAMGKKFRSLHGFKYYIICADDDFEAAFGKKADKKRKVYNGNIRCNFYQYFRKN